MTVSLADQIKSTTEARRHNGQCAYGPWIRLDDEAMPEHVADAIADEAMRRDSGKVDVGGQNWSYRR